MRASRPGWQYGAGIVSCLVLGWIGIVRGDPVPLLSYADLGFHELGHLLAFPLPELAIAMAGSVVQVGVPVGLALVFLLRQRDPLGFGLCIAWAGTSARQVAVYIADAPYERLPLIGGDHDWAFILHRLDAMESAAGVARAVEVLAALLVLAGLAACAVGLLRRPGPGPGESPREPLESGSWRPTRAGPSWPS